MKNTLIIDFSITSVPGTAAAKVTLIILSHLLILTDSIIKGHLFGNEPEAVPWLKSRRRDPPVARFESARGLLDTA